MSSFFALAYLFSRQTLTKVYDGTTEENDLVIIGGGVAGYVAAIKAGQEGLKVRCYTIHSLPATRSES
jgi:succinate dehydrogenase/fumarate reductase flavoprotein subunit